MNWMRLGQAAGCAAAIGLMLAGAGAGGAAAKPRDGGHAAAPPVAKAGPKRDERDDDLEGVPRHVVSKGSASWLLVEDKPLKVGKSLRIRVDVLIAPSEKIPAGAITEANIEIDCKALKWRTINTTLWSTTLDERDYVDKVDDWEPLTLDSPLLEIANAFCNGRALGAGKVPIAPLDILYSMAFDAPAERHLVRVTDDDAQVLELRSTPAGLRPQATLTTVLRQPEDGAAFFSTTVEFDCERRTFRVHRILVRREDGSLVGTSGAEADWQAVQEGPSKVAAAAACEGAWPEGDHVLRIRLGDLRERLLGARWR